MSWTHTLAGAVRQGRPLPWPMHLALTAATPVTRAGMWARRLRTPVQVDAHVISVGNITAGGTGKTPAVIAQLDRLARNAANVTAVLTRGYGTARTGAPLASIDVPEDRRIELLGDEPALILQKHPEVLVIKSRDRVAAARLAIDRHGCNTLVLDDGFQSVRLHRDVDLLLIDATNPFGNGYLLPRGILREPIAAMARATEIVLTRCDQAVDLEALEQTIRQHTDAPIKRTAHRPTAFVQVSTGRPLPLDAFHGSEVVIVSAIGNPEAFRKTAESLGLRVTKSIAYPDHGRIPESDLKRNETVLLTEKDAVKLDEPPDNVYAVSVALEPWA